MKSIFFAIPVIAQERRLLREMVRPLAERLGGDVRWVPEKNWHVTVRFLGSVDERVIEDLAQHAAALSSQVKKFLININTISGFPSSHSRVVAAYVAAHETLDFLFNALDEAALTSGLPKENRIYKPHITLAKFGNRDCRVEPLVFEQLTLHAQELVLFHRKPCEQGSEYIPLQAFLFNE